MEIKQVKRKMGDVTQAKERCGGNSILAHRTSTPEQRGARVLLEGGVQEMKQTEDLCDVTSLGKKYVITPYKGK